MKEQKPVTHFTLRLPEELRKNLQEEAKTNLRSLNNYIVHVLKNRH